MALLTYDRMPPGALRVYKRASDGAWLAEGDTNREGIYLYDEGGRTIRELRTSNTVRRMTPKIARAVLTMGHPDQEVTPDNVQTLGHGDVDGGFDIIDQGGFVRGRQRVALRTADAIARAEAGALKGFSPGYIPVRDETPGVDPKWGAYDRVLVDVAGVNHLALCGDSEDLPPARGGNDICALYLDSQPIKRQPMKRFPNRAAAVKYIRDHRAVLAKLTSGIAKDADLNEIGPKMDEWMADPAAKILVMALAEAAESPEFHAAEGAENAEPMDAPPPMDPAAMEKQMDAAIARHLSPLKAELDALRAEKTARDTAARTSAEREFRTNTAGLGIKDAQTLAIDALVSAAADRLDISTDGLAAADALIVVSRTVAKRAASPGALATLGVARDAVTDDFKIGPAIAAPKGA